ncbi:DUF3077 domain-containing protein [Pseudomonas cichorii]|uniref:DUF6124 family protein n=1 Tax=Pseudomonas cichorii TaxID=36746 RepID=UPI0018E6480D|nr:DUF3077 domain-containing protein [Pseudomonas cichorii]MBI6856213.1 DUF3077 domain-containing protein [Pseudomonas cichorii]
MLDKAIPTPPKPLFIVNDTVSQEEALNYASDLLRCIITTSHESGDSSQGTSRDLAFSVLHLAEMAKAMVDRSIAGL